MASTVSFSRYCQKTTSEPPADYCTEMLASWVERSLERSDCLDMSMDCAALASPVVAPPSAEEVAALNCMLLSESLRK